MVSIGGRVRWFGGSVADFVGSEHATRQGYVLYIAQARTSSANILFTREIWSRGGMMSEIMLVPLLCVYYMCVHVWSS